MKVHEATAKALADNGTETLFGLLGDANMFMIQAFVDREGGRFVAATHEAGAVLMALGHALATGRPAVASVTHGPGLTNSLTALVEGVKARVPLLFLCGDTPVEKRLHFQNVFQREFILAAGAGFEQARAPGTVVDDLARALRRAVQERRPVALNLPAEFEWEEIDYQPAIVRFREHRPTIRQSPELDNAVGILASSRSPIVLAGRGALDAEDALCRLAERSGALLATTLKGKGLFRRDPFNIGVFGSLSTPAASELIAASDCVLAFGASLNRFTTIDGDLLAGKRVVQCDPVEAAIGEHVEPDAGLVGDPAMIAGEIVAWLDEAGIEARGFRSGDARDSLRDCDPFAGLAETSTESTVDLTRALLRLNAALPEDRVFVSDVGRFVGQAWKAIDVARPGDLLHTAHFGSIGLGLGYAIGAATACPDRPTLLVTGDGGFMLSGPNEFYTAVRERADLVVVVCNDGSYGAEYVQFNARGRDPRLSVLPWPGFADLARTLGGEGVTVRNEADLEQACAAVARREGPLLIDLKLDPARMLPLDHW